MANNYEKNINEMVNDLNALKESSFDQNVCDLNKSQINVQSIGSDEVVIHFNLNNKGVVSSANQNDDQRCPDSSDDNKCQVKSRPNSQSNANDIRDGNISEDKSNTQTKSRSSRRTISESINEDSTKGILKYSHNWNRRTVSESNCDSVDPDLDILSLFWHSVEDVSSDEDFCYEKKHKKNVRFSENVSQTVFRPNSSILGRKMKNQKRAKNRKNQRKSGSESSLNDNPNKSECERTRQDSGYDSEDNALHLQNEVSLKAHHKNIEFIAIETGIEGLTFN